MWTGSSESLCVFPDHPSGLGGWRMWVLCSPTLMLPANLPHKGKQFSTRPLPAFHTRWVPAAGGCHRRSAQPSPSRVCRLLDVLCPLRSTRYSAPSHYGHQLTPVPSRDSGGQGLDVTHVEVRGPQRRGPVTFSSSEPVLTPAAHMHSRTALALGPQMLLVFIRLRT